MGNWASGVQRESAVPMVMVAAVAGGDGGGGGRVPQECQAGMVPRHPERLHLYLLCLGSCAPVEGTDCILAHFKKPRRTNQFLKQTESEGVRMVARGHVHNRFASFSFPAGLFQGP